ncbi:MAG: hypothetical protein PHY45_07980 [Rhodocyclaceae bacterium]|nr:hypothetical protein [Rhodocyclaceae bacterium]
MKIPPLAVAATGAALVLGLLSGCASREEKVAVVTPPVVTIPAATTQSSRMSIGLMPTDTPGVLHLQSFAGDVCLQDSNGKAAVSHCVCEQTNCNCETTGATCNP